MSIILKSDCEDILRSSMYNEIKKDLKAIREGRSSAKRIILVVPAQSTLLFESEGFKELGGECFSDFLVVSGAKLRSDVLNECGLPGKTAINTIGRNMLLRSISKKLKPSLKAFSGVCESDGFLELCADFIVQLKQNMISPADLGEIAEKTEKDYLAYNKLLDMQLFYAEYSKAMAGKFTDSEDLLMYTAEKIKESEYIKDSIIWYCNFYSFTCAERTFLRALKDFASDFNIAILAGKDKYIAGNKTANLLSSELNLALVECDKDKTMSFGPKNVRVVACSSSLSEGYSIANDILRKRRDLNCEYGDFMVLCSDAAMSSDIKRALRSYGIPVFSDEKRSIKHSACANAIISCLNIAAYDSSRDDILSLLKCGVLPFEKSELEDFENYVKQYKVFGKAFYTSLKYGKEEYGREKFNRFEEIRSYYANLLEPFISSVENSETVLEKITVLYDFLADKLKLPESLKAMADKYLEAGYADASAEISASWNAVVSLLDQMAELIGSDKMDKKEFAELLSLCFNDIKVGVLPSSENSVSIGDIKRSSFAGVKQLYIAGFNDGLVPSDALNDGILSEPELKDLESNGITLSKNNDTLKLEELFRIESCLNTSCEELTILYCLSDESGEKCLPSSLLVEIKKKYEITSEEKDSSEDLSEFIQNEDSVLCKLPMVLKDIYYGKNNSKNEIWKAAYNNIINSEKLPPLVNALFFKPEESSLESDLACELYSKEGREYMSPSQLEEYALCPFRHFVERGLKAKELKDFELDSRNLGTVYHSILLDFSCILDNLCKEKGVDVCDAGSPWMTVSDNEIKEIIDGIVEKYKSEILEGVLSKSSVEEYKSERIKDVAFAFAKNMVLQIRRGKISEMKFETHFGKNSPLPPLTINCDYGKVTIEGQIDRMDILSVNDEKYVKIIDYKSGSKSFDKAKIEEGIDLQLMIYLESALNSDKSLNPAAVFYYRIKNPSVEGDFLNLASEEISKDLVKKIANLYKLDGMALENEGVECAIDSEFFCEDKSVNNVFSKNRLINEDDFEALRQSFRANLERLCSSLKSGNIDINPKYFKGGNIACGICDYASICIYSVEKKIK